MVKFYCISILVILVRYYALMDKCISEQTTHFISLSRQFPELAHLQTLIQKQFFVVFEI